MKKYIRRLLAFTCALLLSLSLCGCSFLGDWDLSFFGDLIGQSDSGKNHASSQAVEYALTGPTDFYEAPGFDSSIIATYYAGYTVVYHSVVEIDGVQWAGSEEGWFVLSGMPTGALVYTEADQNILLTQIVDVFAEPSLSAEIVSQLEAGEMVYLSQLATAGDHPWGFCDYGWILLDDCYIELDDLNGPVAYGVVRDNDACFYAGPDIYSGVSYSPACGERYGILTIVEVNDLEWCYTPNGWITTGDMYVEGTEGYRACSAIVIDPTPLNVRLAPGTHNEVLTTLTYGDWVNILERVNFNGSDWGYTGEGWIFMDLTDIQ